MDRTEKRRLERERHKLNKSNLKEDEANRQWYSQLPVNRKIFIGKFIERRTIENDNLVAVIMDKCMLGAMDDNTSIDIKLMKKVVDDCNGYILDYKEFLDKYKDGGFDMIEDVKVREEVKSKMIAMISEGSTKVKSMAVLKKEYGLPAAELSDMWLQCKIERTEDKYDKIVNGSKTDDVEVTNSLEIVDEVKVIKGTFGFYHKSIDGLRFSNGEKLVNGDIAYKSKEEVINKKDEWTKEYLDRVESLNKQIEELNNELKMTNKSYETMNSHFNEIEQVFDM